MLRLPLVILLVICGFGAPVMAQSASPRSWRLVVGDGDAAAAPVADARYEALSLHALDEGGETASAFSGPVALRGFRLAIGTDPMEGPWRLDGRSIVEVACRNGVAALPPGTALSEDASVLLAGGTEVSLVRSPMPGWLALLPPLVAIVMAVLLREVLISLLAGIVAGVWLLERDVLATVQRTLDRHIVSQGMDADHFKIMAFTTMLGGLVALIARMGGIRAIVNALARRGRGGRGAQLSTWFMGVLVFFDDYANALLVGNTMRPVSDRYRVSREKLAYLVDSTSAPIACIAVISTWIAAEIGYIADWLDGSEGLAGYAPGAAYQVFLDSIPYNFYPILALLFAFLVALTGRDFGPMLRAERRARRTGELVREGSRPLISREMEAAEPIRPRRLWWWNGVLPLVVVIGGVLVGLYRDGWTKMPERIETLEASIADGTAGPGAAEQLELARRAYQGPLEGTYWTGFEEVRTLFGEASSGDVLLWASGAALLVAALLALVQGFMGIRTLVDTVLGGMKAMLTAIMVLLLAWTLSDLCKTSLNTAGFLVEQVQLEFELLPAAVFVLAAAVGFSTGSSWGTMGILVPLTMAFAAGLGAGRPELEVAPVLLASLGGVLAGAVFGDHCSPISDTTVMSSMAAGSDHVDHVKTQLPYAVSVAVIALGCGYLPAGFGLSPWLCLLLGGGLVIGVVALFGRRAEDAEGPGPGVGESA